MEKRTCIDCNNEQPINNFYIKDKTGRYHYYCKKCAKDRAKKWQKKNIDKFRKLQRDAYTKWSLEKKKYKQKTVNRSSWLKRKEELGDSYIKWLLIGNIKRDNLSLSSKDIPKDLILLKRKEQMLKRKIYANN